MTNIMLAFKAYCIDKNTNTLTELASKGGVSIPTDKLTSPGIRLQCQNELTSFLDGLANKACNIGENIVDSNKLLADELRSLAALVESGERIIRATMTPLSDGVRKICINVSSPIKES